MKHLELAIVRGVRKAPNDAFSAENGVTMISLLQGSQGGFALAPSGGWNPASAQGKPGVWGESGVADGRTLITQPVQNVIETMSLTVSGGTWSQLHDHMGRLYRLAEGARRFWEYESEIEPVYIHWKPDCATGPQYALIFFMDVAVSLPLDSTTPLMDVVLTIEREPFWRWEVEPGGNPRRWTLRDETPLDAADFSLFENTNDLKYETIDNKIELDSTTYLDVLSQNYLDIDDTDIPGDAPALVFLNVASTAVGGATDIVQCWVGRTTTERTLLNRDGDSRPQILMLNFGDAEEGTGTITLGADTSGNISNGSNVNYYYMEDTVAAGVTQTVALWDCSTADATRCKFLPDMNLTRGTFAVFIRHSLTSGDAGDIVMRVLFSEGDGERDKVEIGPGNAINYAATNDALAYIGQITLPLSGFPAMEERGRGLLGTENARYSSNLYIEVELENTIGSSRTIRLVDLILLPIAETIVNTKTSHDVATAGPGLVSIDNTGYLGHGLLDQVVFGWPYGDDDLYPWRGSTLEQTGQPIYLLPNLDNRLHFLWARWDVANEEYQYQMRNTAYVRLNIVPRSYGARWL